MSAAMAAVTVAMPRQVAPRAARRQPTALWAVEPLMSAMVRKRQCDFHFFAIIIDSVSWPHWRILSPLSRPLAATRPSIALVFYRNGFVVDDGELRGYSDPANAAFLAAVERGEVPEEIQAHARSNESLQARARAAGGGAIGVDVTDKRSEDFVPPPYRACGGAGAAVGGGSGHLV